MTEKSLTEACRIAEAISMFANRQRRDCFGCTEGLAMTPEQLPFSYLFKPYQLDKLFLVIEIDLEP